MCGVGLFIIKSQEAAFEKIADLVIRGREKIDFTYL